MTVQNESLPTQPTGDARRLSADDAGTPLFLLDECPDGGFFEVDQWLPALEQMEDALRLSVPFAIDGDPVRRAALGPCPATSMRHGTGMIFVTALIAGALPFLMNWIQGARYGTVAPFIDWARLLNTQGPFPAGDTALPAVTGTIQSIAGLDPWLPAWQAAGLSAFGQWVSWPLQWLAVWIVYGIGVLAVSHLLGARTTLQHFYAGTSYACLPFLLLALTIIPCLGGLAAIVAFVWAFIIYLRAVQFVAGFDFGRAFVSVIAPGALAGLLALLGIGASLLSALRWAVF